MARNIPCICRDCWIGTHINSAYAHQPLLKVTLGVVSVARVLCSSFATPVESGRWLVGSHGVAMRIFQSRTEIRNHLINVTCHLSTGSISVALVAADIYATCETFPPSHSKPTVVSRHCS